MNISSFFIDRPIFASVIAVFITLLGAFAYPALPLAQYPEIAPPSVAVIAAFPGRLGRDDGGDDRRADRAGDQRRRGHALHALELEPGTDGDHRHLPAGHRHRHRAGAGPEPRRARRAAPARAGPPDRRHRQQAGDRLPDGRGDDVDRSVARHRLCRQLRQFAAARPAAAPARRRRRAGVRRRQLFDAGLDRSGSGRRRATSPPTRSSAALRGQNVQVAGGSIGQPPLRRGGAGLRAAGPGPGPPDRPDAVRRRRPQDRCGDRRDHPAARRRPGRARQPGLWHSRHLQPAAGASFMAIQQLPGLERARDGRTACSTTWKRRRGISRRGWTIPSPTTRPNMSRPRSRRCSAR